MRAWVAILVSAFSLSAHSVQTDGQKCFGYLPPNNLKIPVGAKFAGSVNEDWFNYIIDRIAYEYRPEIEARGFKLIIDKQWTQPNVSAEAQEIGKEKFVRVKGGIARHHFMTSDSLAIVVCHEFGHHLGGALKFTDIWPWASMEGQADYFATLKCVRRIWLNDDNEKIVSRLFVPEIVRNSCRSHLNKNEEAICIRAQIASLQSTLMLHDARNPGGPRSREPKPSFATPDPRVVESAIGGHQTPQCRLDTYAAGAACAISHTAALDDANVLEGTCNEGRGARPRCWYAP